MAANVILNLQLNGLPQVNSGLRSLVNNVGSIGGALGQVGRQGSAAGAGLTQGANRAGAAWRPFAGIVSSAGTALSRLSSQGQQVGSSIAAGVDQAKDAIQGLSTAIASLDTELGKATSHKFSAVEDAASNAQDIGTALTIAGTVGALTIANASQNAATVESIKVGLETSLGKEGANDMFAQLVAFDKKSAFSFEQTAKAAQKLIAAGVESKKIIPIMESVADAVAASGGGTEEFEGVLRAIGQIKTNGKLMGEELNQIAERGIGAKGMIVKKFGLNSDQASAIGDQGISADAAIDALVEGFAEEFAGGMEKAAATAKGAAETLLGSIFQLSAAVGKDLAPVLRIAGTALQWLVDTASAVPDPIRKVAVGFFAVSTGLLLLGGGLLGIIGFGTNAVISIIELNASIATLGITSTVSAAGVMKFALITGAAIGLLLITATALYVGINNWNDAVSQSETQWKKSHGTLDALMNAFAAMDRVIYKVLDTIGSVLTLGHYKGQEQVNSETDRAIYEADKVTKERRGEKVGSYEEWTKEREAKHATMSDQEKETEAAIATNAAKVTDAANATLNFSAEIEKAVTSLKALSGSEVSAGGASVPTNTTGLASLGAAADIRSMQRELMSGDFSDEEKKARRLAIFDAQTAQRAESDRERELKREETALRKAGKLKEAEEKRVQREQEKLARQTAAQERKEESQLHREKMQNLRAFYDAEVKAKRMTRAEATAALNAEENAFDRGRLGMGGGTLSSRGVMGGPRAPVNPDAAFLASLSPDEQMFRFGEAIGGALNGSKPNWSVMQGYGGANVLSDGYRGYSGASAASGGALGALGGTSAGNDSGEGTLYGTPRVKSIAERGADVVVQFEELVIKRGGNARRLGMGSVPAGGH